MSKQNKIIILAIVILVLAGYFIWANRSIIPRNDNPLGSDRDKHECIGSAGYSWCEPKGKCLRVWEEACYTNLEQEIQYLLADKYEHPVDEVRVTVTKQTGDYAAGGVKFSADGAGGLFLAAKIDNVWQLIYDGNGSVDCLKLSQEYGFPDEVLKPNFCD